ncbi:MAG: XRE family transcriptional regulator [Gordonia sp. (in: high G+C Gram-positive bacteria)]
MALDTPDPAQMSLGGEIRRLRQDRGMTLTGLAAEAGISHPFLSQLERGYARPSMVTLERIARALQTTQVNLMLAATPARESLSTTSDAGGIQVVRAADGALLPQAGDGESAGYSRLLVTGPAAFFPQEHVQTRREFADYYRHDQDEWVHVIDGAIEVDLDAELIELRARDSLYYAGGIPHRWRVIGDGVARVIVVQAAIGTLS